MVLLGLAAFAGTGTNSDIFRRRDGQISGANAEKEIVCG
jgi:hypothetical protein